MITRMRSSFTLSITVIFCVSAIIAITPFAIIRAMDGEWVIAIIDTSIVIGLLAILVSSYCTKRVKHASVVITGFYTIAAILVTHVDFLSTVYWLYPVFIANFFLLRVWHASLMNLLALLVIASFFKEFESTVEFLSVIATMILANVISGMFSWKIQQQRKTIRARATSELNTSVKTRRQLTDSFLDSTIKAGAGYPTALIMLEIDQLKDIADNFGYEISDALLGNVAGSLTGRLRAETDEIFRFTSRKLVLVLKATSEYEAVKVAESIRLQISDSIQGPEGTITVTLACTELQESEKLDNCISRLESLLDSGQQSGGNTVKSRTSTIE